MKLNTFKSSPGLFVGDGFSETLGKTTRSMKISNLRQRREKGDSTQKEKERKEARLCLTDKRGGREWIRSDQFLFLFLFLFQFPPWLLGNICLSVCQFVCLCAVSICRISINWKRVKNILNQRQVSRPMI